MKRKLLIVFLIVFINFSFFASENFFNNLSEFINVETHFNFETTKTKNRISNIYGATSFSIGDGLPIIYKTNEKVVFFIEFLPTVISDNKSELRKYTRHPENIEIPVSIEITSKHAIVNLIDTKSIYNVEKKQNKEYGSFVYIFSIKNQIEQKRYIKFEITGLQPCNEQIYITYGNSDNDLVESSCNIFETIQFVEE